MNEFKYRPDIDGLRAIAVLLVLVFHANLGIPGGYVGVDVFFVISGFLITGLILKEQQSETFSLTRFWERRIRRILPAAAFMVAVTLVAGVVILLPEDLEKLAESTVAQQLMMANFYFWKNTGYFDGAGELKPLLHTWSLAVEEQFYLGFPFLLVICKRLKTTEKRSLASLFLVLAIASFIVSEWATYKFPSAAFYLLPTRAYELLIGSILACVPASSRLKSWPLELMSWLGLGGIMFASLSYTSATRFPGSAALLPCIGTAFVIFSNSNKPTTVGRLLSTKVLVTLGLMSYSLYLWHWPILAFQRYRLGEILTTSTAVIALLLSVFIAYLSWKFVERPFRKGGHFKDGKQVVQLALLSFLSLVAVSLWVDFAEGLPGRMPDEAAKFVVDQPLDEEFLADMERVQKGDLPKLGLANEGAESLDFIVWGDSHALPLSELCNTLAKEYELSGMMAARAATAPLLETWRPSTGRQAVEWNQAVLEFIEEKKIPNVILISRWAVNIEGRMNGEIDSLIADEFSKPEVSPSESKAALKRGLIRTIKTLEEMGINVWAMKQVPLQAKNLVRMMALAAESGSGPPEGVRIEVHKSRQSNVDAVFSTIDFADDKILDPTNFCFDPSGVSIVADKEGSYYQDYNHLSHRGAQYLLRPLLEPVFKQIAAQK